MATCIGVTALVFAAKGNVWAQICIIIFSILYGIISFRYHYYGEMITYLGMTMPMAMWATYTWLTNPSKQGTEVAIPKLSKKQMIWVLLSATLVTVLFYMILKKLNTPNLFVSTLSITTSFVAAALTCLRSSYYAIWYAANDLVLIVLWVLATKNDLSFLPVAVNFMIFFVNDVYGFVCWKKREKQNYKEKEYGFVS